MSSKEIVLELDVPFLPAKQLKTGHIDLMYEDGRVRYIKYKRREVLRMIYPALRDENWKTIKGKMQNGNILSDEDGFIITYELVYSTPEINYRAEFEISVRNDSVVYTMRGEALNSFKSKRIGLCVHHPILSCAGKKVTIVHPEGRTADYTFPELISPDRPFTDIVSMKWQTANAEVRLDFQGDLFETEDQRNWTDDSYKTYSGPQYKTPILDIKRGDKMMHTVTMQLTDAGVPENKEDEKPVKFNFPGIGYCRSTRQQELTAKEIELIKQLPFNHYRVDLHLDNNEWKDIFHIARKEAQLFRIKIELAVFFTSSAETDELISEIKDPGDIGSLLVLSEDNATAPEHLFKEIYSKLKQSFPSLQTGYGSSSWFADLNGSLPVNAPYDFVSFLVSPQVHQDDNRSILENLESQHTTIETLRSRIGNRPVRVSPVVFNHGADDERLHTSFAAWWTVNAICNFSGAGHVTLYELKGPRGIINDETDPSPVFRLLKTIKDFKPLYILKPKNNEIVIENKNLDQLIIHKKSLHE